MRQASDRTRKLTIRVSDAELDALRACAHDHGTDVSDMIRHVPDLLRLASERRERRREAARQRRHNRRVTLAATEEQMC